MLETVGGELFPAGVAERGAVTARVHEVSMDVAEEAEEEVGEVSEVKARKAPKERTE